MRVSALPSARFVTAAASHSYDDTAIMSAVIPINTRIRVEFFARNRAILQIESGGNGYICIAPIQETLFLCAVQKWRGFLWYWIPVILWMALIFGGSADTGSFQHSSRIIGPILHWLFPDMTPETINRIVTFARKCAHLTEYAILALLFWR